MSQINFGLLANGQNGFQNALQMGLQAGQAFSGMVQAREEQKDRGALADVLMRGQPGMGAPMGQGGPALGGNAMTGGLVATPEQEAQRTAFEQQFPNAPAYGQETGGVDPAMRRLAERDPQTFMRLQTQQREQAQAQRQTDVRQRAAQGDPAAMAELAGFDLTAFRGLNSDQQAEATREATTLGNAAIDILNRPEEQRGQVFNAYIDQLLPQMPELAQYRNLPADQLEPILRSAVARAEMMPRLIDQERPSYQAIPAGGTLVNTRDPAAVASFGQQTDQPAQPVSRAVGGATYYQGPDGTWYDNAQEAMGGGGSNVTSGFPGR